MALIMKWWTAIEITIGYTSRAGAVHCAMITGTFLFSILICILIFFMWAITTSLSASPEACKALPKLSVEFPIPGI